MEYLYTERIQGLAAKTSKIRGSGRRPASFSGTLIGFPIAVRDRWRRTPILLPRRNAAISADDAYDAAGFGLRRHARCNKKKLVTEKRT